MVKRITSLMLLALTLFMLVGCTQNISLSEKRYEAQTEVEQIRIDEETMSIEVVKDENIDNVVVSYYTDDKYKLTVNMMISSKTLSIKREVNHTMFAPEYTYQSYCKTTIYLPINYSGSLDVETVTGNIKISDVSVKELKANTTTGNLTIDSTKASELIDIDVTNGKVEINNTESEKINLDITNGDLLINKTNIKTRIEVDVTNGAIKLNETEANEFAIDLSNGSVELKKVECGELLSVEATTGSIDIELNGKEYSYKTTLSTNVGSVSGETKTGEKIVNCSTNVGSIKVKYLG